VKRAQLRRRRHRISWAARDAGVVVVAAFSALAFGLDQANLIRVAILILLFVPRAARLKAIELMVDDREVERERRRSDPPNVGFLLYDLEGELFFGAGRPRSRRRANFASRP
jgi:sulfate permease, SulP family